MPIKFGSRSIRRSHCTFLFLLVVVCMVGLWLFRITFSTTFGNPNDPTVVVILGGGVTKDGKVSPHTQQRLNVALKLYEQLGESAIFIPLSGGTPHKPNPLDKRGFPVWEATAAAQGLLELGVPAKQILEESFSLDTVGNAYFLRSVHMEPSGLRRMIVITNNWHMPRTQAIFDFVFGLPLREKQSLWSLFASSNNAYSISYRPADAGIDDAKILQLRQDKEAKALKAFLLDVVPVIGTFRDLHLWLFTKHSAYAATRLVEHRNDGVSSNRLNADSVELLKTY